VVVAIWSVVDYENFSTILVVGCGIFGIPVHSIYEDN
jgi:hypothetical protein